MMHRSKKPWWVLYKLGGSKWEPCNFLGNLRKTIGKPYMIKIKTWFQIYNHVKDKGSPTSCFKSPSSRRPGYLVGPTTESTPRRASSPTTTVQQWDSGAQQSGFDRRFCRNNAISESHKLKTCFIKRCEVKCINHREYTFELSRWFWMEHTIMQSCFQKSTQLVEISVTYFLSRSQFGHLLYLVWGE